MSQIIDLVENVMRVKIIGMNILRPRNLFQIIVDDIEGSRRDMRYYEKFLKDLDLNDYANVLMFRLRRLILS